MNITELNKISPSAPHNIERIRNASHALKDDPVDVIISASLLIAAEYYEHQCFDCPDKNKPKPRNNIF